MRTYEAGQCDIAVIGAGHAGIEAALAAARLGMETLCFAINLDTVGNMPCNPAIGGTGKGHLVRELDALGGEMAKAADACCIQYRLLNRSKGPAVWSLRAQADRRRYQEYMKHTLEQQDHLTVRQGEVVEVRTENGAVSAVVLATEDDLHQILYNLMENGIKYSGHMGFVHTALTVEGGDVVIRVEDNGVGISDEDMPHIFERFYRVDKARSREVGGTGLGLSIVSDTVRRRGGTVSVAHRPAGQGTLFTVRLPQVTEEGGST